MGLKLPYSAGHRDGRGCSDRRQPIPLRLDHFLRTTATRFAFPLLVALVLAAFAVVLFGITTGDALTGDARLAVRAATGHLGAATMLILQIALGDRALAGLGLREAAAGRLDRLLFGWVAGVAITTVLWLTLAQAGVLGPTSVSIVALLATAAAAAALPACWRAWRRALRTPGEGDVPFELALAFFLVVAATVWAWPLLVQTALPNADWDSALYHLPLTERYLEGRLLNVDPLYSSYSFPGAISLMYAALLSLGLESAVIPLDFQVGLLGLLATYVLAREVWNATAGLFAVSILAANPIVWQLMVDPRVDGFLATFVTIALIGLVRWLRAPEAWQPLGLFALASGAALGTKYTGLFIAGAMALIPAGFALAAAWRGRPLLSLARLGACAALLLLPNGFWYGANLAIHGDPVFPMLRGDYYHGPGVAPGDLDRSTRLAMLDAVSPYYDALPDDDPIRRTAAIFEERYQRPIATNLFDPLDLLVFRPDEYAVKPAHNASPLLLLFLLMPFASIRADASTRRVIVSCYGLGWFLYLSLGSQTNLLRYVLPVMPLWAAGGGVFVASQLGRRIGRFVVGAVAIALVYTLAIGHWTQQTQLAILRSDLYARDGDRLHWLEAVGYNYTPAMPRVVARINAEIAAGRMRPSDRILMVGEGKGRLLDCDYLPDSSWFLQRWLVELVNADLDYDRIERSLAAQGVTHILYNRAYYRWVVDHTTTPRPTLAFAMTHLERFLRSRTRTVFEAPGMVLVALPPVQPR